MVPMSHALAFALAVTVLIAIPGPSVLFTVSRAVTVGRKSALYTVAGNEIGAAVQVAAVAFGIGTIVERSAQAFLVIKFAGAAYLIYLGVQAIRHRRSLAEALAARVTPVGPPRGMRDGFTVGAANPKTIVFFVVALPQVTSHASGALPQPVQMLILGAIFPAVALIMDSTWAVAAGTARQWFRSSPRWLELLGGAGGVAMVGLGIGVAAVARQS
jgi:threonine/homoserine/homoserine lactone efflux protein